MNISRLGEENVTMLLPDDFAMSKPVKKIQMRMIGKIEYINNEEGGDKSYSANLSHLRKATP